MVTPKTMLCRCEDITLDECEDAIAEGYACFEDLKRFLGVGTGPCQGKSCVSAAMHLVARARGIEAKDVDVMTFRPPVRPIPFETLAADADSLARDGDRPVRDEGAAGDPATSRDDADPPEATS